MDGGAAAHCNVTHRVEACLKCLVANPWLRGGAITVLSNHRGDRQVVGYVDEVDPPEPQCSLLGDPGLEVLLDARPLLPDFPSEAGPPARGRIIDHLHDDAGPCSTGGGGVPDDALDPAPSMATRVGFEHQSGNSGQHIARIGRYPDALDVNGIVATRPSLGSPRRKSYGRAFADRTVLGDNIAAP